MILACVRSFKHSGILTETFLYPQYIHGFINSRYLRLLLLLLHSAYHKKKSTSFYYRYPRNWRSQKQADKHIIIKFEVTMSFYLNIIRLQIDTIFVTKRFRKISCNCKLITGKIILIKNNSSWYTFYVKVRSFIPNHIQTRHGTKIKLSKNHTLLEIENYILSRNRYRVSKFFFLSKQLKINFQI